MDDKLSIDQRLEVDSAELLDDAASSYSDSSSYRITPAPGPPSFLDYKYENGRRYHAFREGSYMLPNDEREQERLEMSHHVYKLILNGALYRAPIGPNPKRVLDLGTGTGAWAIEFADSHPECDVIGTDLSLIQPSWIPPNCQFFIDDVRSPWTYGVKFDLVHLRSMLGSVGDWDNLLRETYDHLTDGGWVEIQEFESEFKTDDDTFERTPNILLWNEKFNEAGEIFGQPCDIATKQKTYLERAGFVDVQDEVYKIPVGSWAKDRRLKEIGRVMLMHAYEGLEAFSLAFFNRVLGWTREQIDDLTSAARAEMRKPGNHIYVSIHFIYGRKPQ